jgi:hypothetical protein
MMKIFLQWFAVLFLLLIISLYVAGEAEEKRASALYARAHLSEVQNEGRKDMMTGLMPYAIIGVSAIGGTIAIIAMTYGLVTVAAIWINRPQTQTQTHIIERQIIVMLQDGQSRRDFFKQLEQRSKIKLLKD